MKLKYISNTTFFFFLANLGGVFGLCLGCSAISVMEILFYLYWATKNNIKKCARKVINNRVGLAQTN